LEKNIGGHLEGLGRKGYRKKSCLDYVGKEDSPRSMNYQLTYEKSLGFPKG